MFFLAFQINVDGEIIVALGDITPKVIGDNPMFIDMIGISNAPAT